MWQEPHADVYARKWPPLGRAMSPGGRLDTSYTESFTIVGSDCAVVNGGAWLATTFFLSVKHPELSGPRAFGSVP